MDGQVWPLRSELRIGRSGASAPESTARDLSVMRDLTKRKSVDHTIRHGVASMLRCVVNRDDFDTPDLASLVGIRATLESSIIDAVANLRDQGHSWSAIARELGVSRQEAHRRYRNSSKGNEA